MNNLNNNNNPQNYNGNNNDLYNNVANNEFNMTNNVNYTEPSYTKEEVRGNSKKLTQNASKVLTQSLLWFGLGFLLVAGLGSLWVYLITKNAPGNELAIESDGFTILWVMLSVSLVGSLVFSLFASFTRRSNSLVMTVVSYVFYILMFSMLFAVVSIGVNTGFQLTTDDAKMNANYIILTAFAITGGLTLLSGLIAAGLTLKGALSLTKIITTVVLVTLLGNIIFMCIYWVVSDKVIEGWYFAYDIIFCIVMVVFMILTFFKIINFSRLADGQQLRRSTIVQLGICFGTEILINFMIIFMYVVNLLLRRN